MGLAIFFYIRFKKDYAARYNWTANYKRTNDQPYGTKLFYSFLKERKEGSKLITNQDYSVLDTSLRNTNFICMSTEFECDSVAAMHLLRYAEKGNKVFLAVDVSPTELLRYFVPRGDSIMGFVTRRDSVVKLYFPDDLPYPGKIDLHYKVLKDTIGYNWGFYSHKYFRDTLSNWGFVSFSHFADSAVNSFYIDHGKGRIVVHANPILFTNYYFVRRSGFRHANNMLSQLDTGTVYWDEPSNNYSGQGNHQGDANNPLTFLFSDHRLRWAWYLFISTVILYLVFRSKREQRIIPLMPVNSNSSIEYTRAIGTLYFQSKGHHHIASEMYHVFLAEVRSRYFITTDIPEDQLIDQLSQRSGIEKTFLFHLFKQFSNLRNNEDASGDELIGLYNTIDSYHKKRK